MRVKAYLKKVANIVDSEIQDDDGKIYVSKFDGSYITRVGMEKNIKFLADLEITEDLQHGVGFSPKDSKWYGWSHRAIFGFEIGSTCEKGNCHYFAKNIDDEIEAAIRFWDDEGHENTTAEKTSEGILRVTWKYAEDKKTIPNEDLHGQISGVDWHYNTKFGRGEWVAKTTEDAKQMAIDFNEGVS